MIFKITYGSMTAFYELGYIRAENKEIALSSARGRATAFFGSEKNLIKARPITKSEEQNITLNQVKDA